MDIGITSLHGPALFMVSSLPRKPRGGCKQNQNRHRRRLNNRPYTQLLVPSLARRDLTALAPSRAQPGQSGRISFPKDDLIYYKEVPNILHSLFTMQHEITA